MTINTNILLELSKKASNHAWQMARDSYHGVSEVSTRQMHEWEIRKYAELVIDEYLKETSI